MLFQPQLIQASQAQYRITGLPWALEGKLSKDWPAEFALGVRDRMEVDIGSSPQQNLPQRIQIASLNDLGGRANTCGLYIVGLDGALYSHLRCLRCRLWACGRPGRGTLDVRAEESHGIAIFPVFTNMNMGLGHSTRYFRTRIIRGALEVSVNECVGDTDDFSGGCLKQRFPQIHRNRGK